MSGSSNRLERIVQALVDTLGPALGADLVLRLRSDDDWTAESHLMQLCLRGVRGALSKGPHNSMDTAAPADEAGAARQSPSTSRWLCRPVADAVQRNLTAIAARGKQPVGDGAAHAGESVSEAQGLVGHVGAGIAALNIHRFLRLRFGGQLPGAFADAHGAACAQCSGVHSGRSNMQSAVYLAMRDQVLSAQRCLDAAAESGAECARACQLDILLHAIEETCTLMQR